MNKYAIINLVLAIAGGAGLLASQDPPQAGPSMPVPTKEHLWLQQFAGDWESEFELFFDPGNPPLQCKGTGSARSIGGFWIVSEGKADMLGMPFESHRRKP